MRIKILFSIVADALWTWIVGGVFAVIGIIVFVYPNLGQYINWPSFILRYPWYVYISLAFFIWSIGFAWSASKRIFVEPSELLELAKIRGDGAQLRASSPYIKNRSDLETFKKKYENWNQNMITLVSKLSESKAEELANLWEWPVVRYDSDIDNERNIITGILSARLAELISFIDDYRRSLYR
jgi:hypothetical protein